MGLESPIHELFHRDDDMILQIENAGESAGPRITDMYGIGNISIYTRNQLIAQLVLSILWALVAVFLFIWSFFDNRKTNAKRMGWYKWLQFTLLCIAASFALVAARFGLLIDKAIVDESFRLEPAFSSLLLAIVQVVFITAIFHILAYVRAELNSRQEQVEFAALTPITILITLCIAIVGCLLLAIAILDFPIAAKAIDIQKATGVWVLFDRNIGVLLTDSQFSRLMSAGSPGSGIDGATNAVDILRIKLSPREWASDWMRIREGQIGVEIGASISILLLLILFTVHGVSWAILAGMTGDKYCLRIARPLTAVAIPALIFLYFFKAVIVIHFIQANWEILSGAKGWDLITSPSQIDVPLNGYRKPVDALPIIRLVIEPLCLLLVGGSLLVAGVQRNEEEEEEEQADNERIVVIREK